MTVAALPPLALYVHLPWCVSKCPYCDFNSHTMGPRASLDEYIGALLRDLESESASAFNRSIDSVFLGGGTPSLFSPAHIETLITAIDRRCHLAADAEITMEANPGTVERGSLSAYRKAGINRLSLGAQSFDAASLRRLGRIHGPGEIFDAYKEARSAQFDSINLDLMIALPEQTSSMALADIGRAIELGPEHISCYQLTLEPNTVFYARPPQGLPDDDQGFEIQEQVYQRLAAAGYERYEVSAFARSGFACRHNLNYWLFGDYLGIGAGAHGKLTDPDGDIWRTQKTAHPGAYMQQMAAGEGARLAKQLPAGDLGFEFMLNALRLRGGFDTQCFEERTGLPLGRWQATLDAAAAEGLMERLGDDHWQPTALGFRFLNDLQARFLPASDASLNTGLGH